MRDAAREVVLHGVREEMRVYGDVEAERKEGEGERAENGRDAGDNR